MPKNNTKDKSKDNPKDRHKEDAQYQKEEGIEKKLPSDSSSQTDEDILTYQDPEEERTIESERPDGDMRK